MSALPQAQRWNRFFQRHVTSSLVLEDDYFLRKWGHCEEHLDALAAAGGPASFTAVELGTGWLPGVPLGLVLNGAERVWSVDIHPMLERAAVVETMRRYVQLADRVRVARPSTLDRMAELARRRAPATPPAFSPSSASMSAPPTRARSICPCRRSTCSSPTTPWSTLRPASSSAFSRSSVGLRGRRV